MRAALNQRSTAIAARSISPQKLLLSKWTAVKPVGKQKHFLVIKVLPAEVQADVSTPEWVEIEAVYLNATKWLV